MKAAYLSEYGGESAVHIVNDAPKPEPAAEEVVVEVQVAGVNPFDYKLREGTYKEYIPLELPAIPGGDFSGTVAAIGTDVIGFEIGQKVYGMANAAGGHGSFAEFTAVKAKQLVSKPSSIDFLTAAALPLAAISAYQALVDHINLQPSQKILIHGGAGGIGSLAIQIAKNIGAYVATTVSESDKEFVKSIGADEIIDYKSQDFSEILSNYDAVLDNVGGETNTKSYTILKPGGKFVSMVQPINEELAQKYNVVYTQQSSKPTIERLTKISKLVDSGILKVNVDKVFSFAEAAQALEYLKTAHPKGKLVIQIK